MTYPEIAKVMKTAKRGTWQKLSETAQTLVQLHMTTGGETYHTSFEAKDEGAFFIICEGLSIGYELMIIFPDAVMTSFNALSSLTAQAAMASMAQMAGTHGTYSGLDEFVEWFDSKWNTYGMFVNQLTITLLGHTISGSSLPSYSNASHNPSTWFTWVKDILVVAGADPAMSGIWNSSTYAYAVTMRISAESSLSADMTFYIGI